METRSIPRTKYDTDILYMGCTDCKTPGFIVYDEYWQFFTPFEVRSERVDDNTVVPVVAGKKWVLPNPSRELYIRLFPDFVQSKYKSKIEKFLPYMLRVEKKIVVRF